jgi:hypothetical protein
METRNKNMIIADMENDEPISFHINKEDKVFAVPDNYFSEFPAKILFNIRLENMDKSVPYAVPEQYFSEFPDKILKRIEDEETPVLKTVSKENVYAVQGNYFENFSRQITKKIKEENDEVKVIPLRTKRKRWQMTAAAAVVAAAVLSSSLFLENRKSAREHEHQYYASVLNDGDSSNVGGFDQDLSGLSNSEINDYLASPNFSDSCITESANEQATQREISEMSNEAMESYLNQTPTVY